MRIINRVFAEDSDTPDGVATVKYVVRMLPDRLIRLHRLNAQGVRRVQSPSARSLMHALRNRPILSSQRSIHVHHDGTLHAKAPCTPPADTTTSAGGFIFGG